MKVQCIIAQLTNLLLGKPHVPQNIHLNGEKQLITIFEENFV
jgi:hypothetical protein